MLKIQYRPIGWFRDYENNPRINDHAVEKMAALIAEFGFRIPIAAKKDHEVVDGHLRLKAARLLRTQSPEWKAKLAKLPMISADDLTPEQIKAFRISANKAAEFAEWDFSKLASELTGLTEAGYDVALTGFDDDELQRIVAEAMAEPSEEKEADAEEAAPLPPTKPVSLGGDLWRLGAHRVLCGDATRKADVERLLGQAKPHLMVTDPPYGVDYDPGWRNQRLTKSKRAEGLVKNDGLADWRPAWALFPGAVAYVWHAGLQAPSAGLSLIAAGFGLRAQIIWVKHRLVISRSHYHFRHEPCWYAVRDGATAKWEGDHSQTTIWEFPHAKSETGHGTQKPVEAMRRPMLNNSVVGDVIYDPFLGSGTSIIAAETCARVCLGLEIDPAYCDVIVRRWQRFTGERALLDGSGGAFTEVERERAKENRPGKKARPARKRQKASGGDGEVAGGLGRDEATLTDSADRQAPPAG